MGVEKVYSFPLKSNAKIGRKIYGVRSNSFFVDFLLKKVCFCIFYLFCVANAGTLFILKYHCG